MYRFLILGIGFVFAFAHVDAKPHRKKIQKDHCERGPRGLPGPMGPMGPMGPRGLAGQIGVTGITGVTGFAGQVGATGITGATGLAGQIGATGITGATGPAVALSGSYASFYGSNSQSQDLGANSSVFLQFDQSYAQVGITPSSSMFLTGYDTFEITQEGVYLITWVFNVAPLVGGGSGTKIVSTTLYKNGLPQDPEPINHQSCVAAAFGSSTPIPITTSISGSISIPLAPTDKIKLQVSGSTSGGDQSESVGTLYGRILTITQIS